MDVRDVGQAHRLAMVSGNAGNGSRYILSATDPSGELFTWQLQARLAALFPEIEQIGGEEMAVSGPAQPTYDSPRAYCELARSELGLVTHSIDDTLLATGRSYQELSLL